MSADQVWQTIANVAAVGALLLGAFWRLSATLEGLRSNVASLKAEMQQDVSAVRADVNLLRASVDSKLALAEAQTKAEIVALRAATERLDEEVSRLAANPPRPTRRRGAA